MRLAIVCMFAAGFSASALGDEPVEDKDVDTPVAMYATCAGLYKFMAEFSLTQGNTATATHIRGLHNGARFSALYILGMQYAMNHPKDPPRPYGDWAPLVDPRIENESIRIAALAENNNLAQIEKTQKLCGELTPFSEQFINQARKEAADLP